MKKNYYAILILIMCVMLTSCGKQKNEVTVTESTLQKEAFSQVAGQAQDDEADVQDEAAGDALQSGEVEVSNEAIDGVVIYIDEPSENTSGEQDEENAEQTQDTTDTSATESAKPENGETPTVPIETPTSNPATGTTGGSTSDSTATEPEDSASKPTESPSEEPTDKSTIQPSEDVTIELPFVPIP